MVPTSILARVPSITVASCASTAPSARSSVTAKPCAASRSATEPRSPRRSSSRRATRTARFSNGCAIRRRARATSSGGGVPFPIRTATSRRSTLSSRERRACGPLDAPLGATTIVAPSLAEIDRAHRLMLDGQVHPTPGLLVNVPSLLDPAMTAGDETRHVLEPRSAVHAVPAARRLAGVDRAAALARAVRRICASRASSTRSARGGR